MSVGYDLAGIQTEKVVGFIRGMQDATESVDRLRDQLPHRLRALRDLDYPTKLSRSITLSTFHGCPADEIERICEFLLTEIGVDVIVKMNPPDAWQRAARASALRRDGLHRNHGQSPRLYERADVRPVDCDVQSFERTWPRREGWDWGEVLQYPGGDQSSRLFYADKRVMYLSGLPLHVITLTLANEFRQHVGPQMPISFSAGIDRKNVASTVACGTCPSPHVPIS